MQANNHDLTDEKKAEIDAENREHLPEFREDAMKIYYENDELVVLDVVDREFDGIAEAHDIDYTTLVRWMHDRSPVAPEYGTPLVIAKV